MGFNEFKRPLDKVHSQQKGMELTYTMGNERIFIVESSNGERKK